MGAAGRQRRRLRVAWLGHASTTIGDGLRTYSREGTAGLRERGVEVVFIHHEPSLADGESSFALGAVVAFQRRVVISNVGSRPTIARLLREQAIDVVHLSVPFTTLDFRLPHLCRRLGLPLVATFHVPFADGASFWGTLAAGLYRLYAPALSRCDGVIVLGEKQRRLLADLGVPADIMTVQPNGVDLDRYSPGPSDVARRFGAERIFTYLGRVDPEKQVEALVRAFLEVSPPDSIRLLVVGSGADSARLRRRYRDDRVVFLGTVLDEMERIQILRGSDAFFLPSRVEALSIAMLEAMACGAAVVATDAGDDGAAVRGAGMVVDARRVNQELPGVIRRLIDSPQLCRRLGRLARRRVIERFSLAPNLDRLVGLYQRVSEASTDKAGSR